MILAPRSCPSSPGFAIKTLIFFSGMKRLGDGDFFVGAEDFAHGVADFTKRGIRLDGVVDEGHEIFGGFCGGAQGGQAARDLETVLLSPYREQRGLVASELDDFKKALDALHAAAHHELLTT